MPNISVNHSLRMVSMLSLSAFLIWLLYYFNATPLYFELLAFHTKVISISILMVIWTLIMLTTIMLKRKISFAPTQAALLVLVIYMLLTTIIHLAVTPNVISVIGVSSFGTVVLYIALFVILLTQMMVPGKLSQAVIYKWLSILAVPVIFFGMSQVVSGYSQITKVVFSDYVKNVPYDFYGFNRPYSFFTQAANFGWYMALLAALMWLFMRRSPSLLGKVAYFSGLIIAVTANVLSFTRISILTLLFVLFFLWYSKGLTARGKKAEFIPVAFFAVTIILFFFAGEFSEILKGFLGVLAHSSSVSIRENELAYYLKMYGSAKWWQILIGIGPIINSVPAKTNMFIDNTYLYMLLQYGAAGIILWLVVNVIIWRDMYLLARREPGILRTAVVAFWSTWLAVGLFATDLSVYILVAIIFYMVAPGMELRSGMRSQKTMAEKA